MASRIGNLRTASLTRDALKGNRPERERSLSLILDIYVAMKSLLLQDPLGSTDCGLLEAEVAVNLWEACRDKF